MGKDANIVIDEEMTGFAVNGDVLHVKAGNWEVLVRDPPLAVSYRTPRKTAYIVGGIIMMLIGLFFIVWNATVLSVPHYPHFGYGPMVIILFGVIFVLIGIVLAALGLRTKAVVTIESRTGTVVSVRANPYIAHNLIEDLLKKQTVQPQ